MPKSWTRDLDRCADAGIPAVVTFATKPQLAKRMIERAVAAKVPFAWVAGDEVYGSTGHCAPGWNSSTSPTCWRLHAATGYPPGPGAPSAPMSWLPAGPEGLAAALNRRGSQRSIEEKFQVGKGLTGRDEHQVRRWTTWYLWVTLAMLAGAVLTIAAALEHARSSCPADKSDVGTSIVSGPATIGGR